MNSNVNCDKPKGMYRSSPTETHTRKRLSVEPVMQLQHVLSDTLKEP